MARPPRSAGAGGDWPARRRRITRDAAAVAAATGAYGLSFGALSVAAGLSVLQTQALSALMFTGGSQFALVGLVGGGGGALGGAATAILLGARNAFYGLRLAGLLGVRGLRRVAAAQITIDETTAMAVAQEGLEGDPEADLRASRYAFWATGILLFACWNLGTLIGAVGGEALSDPAVLGLDAAAPAAFLALMAPQLRRRRPIAIALTAAVVAVVLTPLVPAGVPVLAAGVVGITLALTGPDEGEGEDGADAPATDQEVP